MTTHYLRFIDQSAFESAADDAGLRLRCVRARNSDGTYSADNPATPDNEAWDFVVTTYSHDLAIDVIGTIYNRDAVINHKTSKITTEATAIPGWHVNVIGNLPVGWDEFLVYPVSPYRVFA